MAVVNSSQLALVHHALGSFAFWWDHCLVSTVVYVVLVVFSRIIIFFRVSYHYVVCFYYLRPGGALSSSWGGVVMNGKRESMCVVCVCVV